MAKRIYTEASPGSIRTTIHVCCGVCNITLVREETSLASFIARIRGAKWRAVPGFGWVCPTCYKELESKKQGEIR